ncbi:MAG: aldo/keto reductase [Treponema sp.]|nr:aldo/keto reductase [Treponema sp.]
MKYLKLLPSLPDVSALCLGTVSFGSKMPQKDAYAQMDRFAGYGGNFFDTARVYADWLPGGHGASEKCLGGWAKERKCRSRVIFSTKGGHPVLKTMNVPRMGKNDLRFDLEESLKALQTDYIDIYFLHRDDVSKPAEEILLTMEEFKKEGKIRQYGFSNWTLPRMIEAKEAAKRLAVTGFICDQIRFGLADLNTAEISDKTTVSMDFPIFNWHLKTKMPVMAYTSSCNGYFSKKLNGSSVSPAIEKIYGNQNNKKILEKLTQWEKSLKIPAAALVAAYVMAQDFPAVPIASFSAPEQLEETIKAADFNFPVEFLAEINKIKEFTTNITKIHE